MNALLLFPKYIKLFHHISSFFLQHLLEKKCKIPLLSQLEKGKISLQITPTMETTKSIVSNIFITYIDIFLLKNDKKINYLQIKKHHLNSAYPYYYPK